MTGGSRSGIKEKHPSDPPNPVTHWANGAGLKDVSTLSEGRGGWDEGVEGRFKREGIHVYVWHCSKEPA